MDAKTEAAPGKAGHFSWEDPLLLDAELTEDERMVRDSARAYCQDKLMGRVLEANRHEKTDPAIFREMGELGLLGCTIEGYGCAGTNYVTYGLVARGGARRFRLPLDDERAVVAGHAPDPRLRHRGATPEVPAEACHRRVDRLLRPDRPDHGSDPGGMRTRARKVSDGWVPNGSKMWITNSPIADVFVVWAKDDEGVIRGFVLDKGAKGLSAPKIEGKFSLRASVTGEIVLDEVHVPDDALLPHARGLGGPFGCLNRARFPASPGGRWGRPVLPRHPARQYTLDRKQFGRPLAWPDRPAPSSPTWKRRSRWASPPACGSAA